MSRMLEERIQNKYPFLTKKHVNVADFLLSRSQEAAFLTASQMARQLQTCEATIVRFSRAIGYRGYTDMQKELRENIKKKLSPPKVLENSLAKERGEDIYFKTLEMDILNIQKIKEANSKQILDQVGKEIHKAQRIGITGFGAAHSVAYLLCLFLGQIRKNCEQIGLLLRSLPNEIINYGKGDLLIGISYPRYARQTLQIMRWAKDNKCRTIAITDKPVSPIGQIADVVLLVENRSPSYFNSITSSVSLVNCLVAAFSLKNRESIEVLRLVNQKADELGFRLI